MLEKIRLTHYRGFEDTGDIHIAPVTLLLGKNNSGKSSLLKALSLIHDGLAYGNKSRLSLRSETGVISGSSLADLFHRRQFTDLGFYLDFTRLKYEIHLIGNNGKVIPSAYRIAGADIHPEKTAQGADIHKEMAGLYPTTHEADIPGLADLVRFNLLHIGPLRIAAPAIIAGNEASARDFVGYSGEHTYSILLGSYLSDGTLLQSVSEWFTDNLGITIGFEPIDAQGTNFRPYAERDGMRISIADSGLGIAQVLPVITQTFIHGEDTIICIEQPALHLHPDAHAAVSRRIAHSAKETDMRYIIESHSKNFLLGLRLLAVTAEEPFANTDAAIYYIESSEIPSIVEPIKIETDGSLSYWPTGVFGEDTDLLDKILDSYDLQD